MRVLEEVLELLADARWHSLDELERVIGLSKKPGKVISFLAEYDFINVDWERYRAKISPLMHQFLKEIKRIEVQEAWKRRAGFSRLVK